MSKADKIKSRRKRKMFWVPGRNRKRGERIPSGELRKKRETVEEIQSVAKKNPDRRWYPDPGEPSLEWSIGQLHLVGQIDEHQYRAAKRYIDVMTRARPALDAPQETAQALDMAREPTGRAMWTIVADDEDMLAATRDAIASFGRMRQALADCSIVLHGFGNRGHLENVLRTAAYSRVVIDIGDLRSALNALVRLWEKRKSTIW